MDVAEFRAHPRILLDLEEEDLPDVLLDRWLVEGFRKIAHRVRRWPFYEASATVVTAADVQDYDLVGVDKVRSVHGPYGEMPWVDESVARQEYWLHSQPFPSSWPRAWSQYADKLRVYPAPDQAYTITVLGYREPSTSWVESSGGEPDFPDIFNEVLLNWVMYRTYLHQDDPELGEVELRNFEAGLDEMGTDEVTAPVTTAGLVLGGGHPHGRGGFGLGGRLPFPFE